jgi:Domain of unknown function (DUF5655)
VPVNAMWKCDGCGRRFANRNQSHSCGRYTLRSHLRGRTPQAVAVFRAFVKMARRCGRVIILPEKTRIAFQVRMSFAAVSFRRDGLNGHVVLARRLENPRFTSIQTISPRNHVHCFQVRSLDELDREVMSWLREAYRVGKQLHLKD